MAIDTDKIVHAVMHGSRIREEKGIIPLFGVYLSMIPVDFYNKISFGFEKQMQQPDEAESLLVNAAQECGYATFAGVRSSREWAEVVQPMISNDKDQIYSFVSIAIAFGWGDLGVRELIPGEKLVMRASDSYEAKGYWDAYGRADAGKCYMLRGVAAAFMDLVYGGEYPDGCFRYKALETHCQAKGDPYCEFVARKAAG
ncbi:MAG: 4-vinyl reductase [Deltaproteobacteria bacterium]|jgi:predicted hydrocarbon binding protein|nr:4-vinyl reductase [Deltaproteobacteria bacterium]MBW2522497.1 4-vinyl reductase [Deltaproteobacteria bacterium]